MRQSYTIGSNLSSSILSVVLPLVITFLIAGCVTHVPPAPDTLESKLVGTWDVLIPPEDAPVEVAAKGTRWTLVFKNEYINADSQKRVEFTLQFRRKFEFQDNVAGRALEGMADAGHTATYTVWDCSLKCNGSEAEAIDIPETSVRYNKFRENKKPGPVTVRLDRDNPKVIYVTAELSAENAVGGRIAGHTAGVLKDVRFQKIK